MWSIASGYGSIRCERLDRLEVNSMEKTVRGHKFKATGVNLFTGLTTFGGREAMFFVRENKMTPIRKEMKPEELADPTLLLAGGGFKHGQHLAFDSRNNTPLCRLFVSMLQNIGIETDSFSSGIGTLPGFVPA